MLVRGLDKNHTHHKLKALSSNSSTTKKKRKKEGRRKTKPNT
jgi:hypothetical protein